MFSARLPADLAPSAFARLISETRDAGTPILDLTESNPTRAGIVYPVREILDGFQDPRALVYDPESLGLLAARELIAERERVAVDRVLLTASTSEAYSWLLKLLCNPGDEILVPRPSYPLFDLLANLESVVVRHYPIRYYRGWFVDTHALDSLVNKRTRAIVVVNPNNPTGSYLKRHEQQEIASICANRNIALISDEVFADYSLCDDAERARSITGTHGRPLAFSLNGLSKLVGMPQMKLGWMIVSGEFRHLAMAQLEVIADTYLSVGTPVQYALPALLAAREPVQAQILSRLGANLAWLRDRIAPTSASLLRVEGGWYAVLQVPRIRSEEEWVTELLREYSVLVQPGYFYDFESEAYLILSLLTPQEVLQEGVKLLLMCLSGTG